MGMLCQCFVYGKALFEKSPFRCNLKVMLLFHPLHSCVHTDSRKRFCIENVCRTTKRTTMALSFMYSHDAMMAVLFTKVENQVNSVVIWLTVNGEPLGYRL